MGQTDPQSALTAILKERSKNGERQTTLIFLDREKMQHFVFPFETPSNGTDNHTIAIPSSIGQGSVETIYCNSGIRLMVSDITLHRNTIVKTEPSQPCYGFGFCLSGTIEARPACFNNAFVIKGGQSGFFNFPEMEGHTEIMNTERILRIGIYMSPDLLPQFAGKNAGQLPSILRESRQVPFRNADKITPAMQAALHQILNCTFPGVTQQLYIEGKVLELIAHKIAQLDARSKPAIHKKTLTSNEIERIRHAANLLSLDLEHPPSIAELSGHVGMCRSKLYSCFHEVYGITPFGYLQQKRMETAGRLLGAGEINVTQAAYAVGYSSLSHFTKAFKKHFGVPPSQCLTPLSDASRICT